MADEGLSDAQQTGNGGFSRRYWQALANLDRRVGTALSAYEAAARRFRASITAVSAQARAEFHMELVEAAAQLRLALRDLAALQERRTKGTPRVTKKTSRAVDAKEGEC